MDAGANASVLPAVSVSSLVGFGAVVAALPAFEMVRDWVLAIKGGPLVSLAVAANVLAALTGSASGGLTIALDALGQTYSLDILPHNGAVVTLLAICGSTHRESYFGIVSAVLGLVTVILLGTLVGSF
jgi:H+/gluconate symporter-like permease